MVLARWRSVGGGEGSLGPFTRSPLPIIIVRRAHHHRTSHGPALISASIYSKLSTSTRATTTATISRSTRRTRSWRWA